eukprot:gene15593-193_t
MAAGVEDDVVADLQWQAAGVAGEELYFELISPPEATAIAPTTADAFAAAAARWRPGDRRRCVTVSLPDGRTIRTPLGRWAALVGAASGDGTYRFMAAEFGGARCLVCDRWPRGAVRSLCAIAGGKGVDAVFDVPSGRAGFVSDTVMVHEHKTGQRREGLRFEEAFAGDLLLQFGRVLVRAQAARGRPGEDAATLQAGASVALLTRCAVAVGNAEAGRGDRWVDAVLCVAAELADAARLIDAYAARGDAERAKMADWRLRAEVVRTNVTALRAWGRCVDLLRPAPVAVARRYLAPAPVPAAEAPAAGVFGPGHADLPHHRRGQSLPPERARGEADRPAPPPDTRARPNARALLSSRFCSFLCSTLAATRDSCDTSSAARRPAASASARTYSPNTSDAPAAVPP